MSAIQELFSGGMYKCGGKVKSWNKRFFILKTDYHLYYYKGTSKVSLGNISLHDPKFKVRKGEATDIPWPKGAKADCRMAVITTLRTYFMYCDYSHEIEEWLEILTKAAMDAHEGKEGNASLEAGHPASSSTAAKEEQNKPQPQTADDIQPLDYEPYEPDMNAKHQNGSTPPPDDNDESVYAVASEVQPLQGEYVDVNTPTTMASDQEEESLMYEAITEPNQDIYDSVLEVIDNYSGPSTTNQPQAKNDAPPFPYGHEDQPPPLPDRNDAPPLPEKEDGVPSLLDEEGHPLPNREGDITPLPEKEHLPPLPDKEDHPPLSDKEDRPPLPDKEDHPPLPDKEDHPPLPDKEDQPPLPDKEDHPSLPDKEDHPPLPDKVDLSALPDKEDCPPLPDKEDSPPLPDKEDRPPLPDKEDCPPLPDKEDLPALPEKEGIPPLPEKDYTPEKDKHPVQTNENSIPLLPLKDNEATPTSSQQFLHTDSPHSHLQADEEVSPQSSPNVSPHSSPRSPLSTHSTPQSSPFTAERSSPQISPQRSPQLSPRTHQQSPAINRQGSSSSQRSSSYKEEENKKPSHEVAAEDDPIHRESSGSRPTPTPRKNTNPTKATSALTALHELFSGVLYKCGGKVKSWTKRFFVLKSDYCLYYYKDTSKGPLGTISLLDPKFKVRKGEISDIPWPKGAKADCRMAIITTLRTYFTYCDYSHEIEEWLDIITKAATSAANSREDNRLLGNWRSASTVSNMEEKEKTKPRPLSTNDVRLESVYASLEDDTALHNMESVYACLEDDTTLPSDNMESMYALATEVISVQSGCVEIATPTPVYEAVVAEPDQDIYDSVPMEAVNVYSPATRPGVPTEDNYVPPFPQRGEDQPPPLPDRNDAPPLLDKDGDVTPSNKELPPLPDKEKAPPLPEKEERPLLLERDIPPLPDKEEVPSLPDKVDVPPAAPKRKKPPIPVRRESLKCITPPPLLFSDSPQHHLEDIRDISPKMSPHSSPRSLHSTHSTQGSSHSAKRSSPNISPQPSPRKSPQHSPVVSRRASPRSSPASSSPYKPDENVSPQRAAEDPVPTEPGDIRPVPRTRKNSNPSNVRAAKPRSYTEYQPREVKGHLNEEGATLGQHMFLKRRDRIEEVDSTNRKKESLRNTLEDMKSDRTVAPRQAVTIAETLREVEQERQIASEERFRWERERKKLEEERQKFEDERQKMKEEMMKMQMQLQKS